MLVSVLEVAALVGRRAAAAHRDRRRRVVARGPRAGVGAGRRLGQPREARRAAGHQTCVCIYGAGPTAPSRRAGRPRSTRTPRCRRSAAELPEADHNEIVGWESASALGSFMAVFLEDSDQHPRVRQRVELTAAADRARGGRHAAPREPGVEPRSSACCRSCCSATSCRSTSRCCAASTRRRSSRSSA